MIFAGRIETTMLHKTLGLQVSGGFDMPLAANARGYSTTANFPANFETGIITPPSEDNCP